MFNPYCKIFRSILRSSIWYASDAELRVWLTMLVEQDKDHQVLMSSLALAAEARVSLEDCEKALKRFMEPDRHSNTKDNEGRRIKEIEGGWFILNGAKYREMMSKYARRDSNTKAQAGYRARQKKAEKLRWAIGRGRPLPGQTAAIMAMNEGADDVADRITTDALPDAAKDEPKCPPALD